MSIRPWIEAADLVLADLRDVPAEMLEQKMRDAARLYFQTAHCWRESVDPFVTAAGVADYDVIDTRYTEVSKVLVAFIGSDELIPVGPDDFVRMQAREQTGQPKWVAFDGSYMLLHPTPTTAGQWVRAEVVYQPSSNAPGLPAELWRRHHLPIAHGAKWLLCSTHNKPYASPQLAQHYAGMFQHEIEIARTRATTGSSRARRAIRAHFH